MTQEAQTEKWWIYECDPIDWWDGWLSLDSRPQADWEEPHQIEADPELRKEVKAVLVAFRRHTHWEGDIVGGPYVSGLPCPEHWCSLLMFAVKQSNNGSVFVASPYRLPWLDNYCVHSPEAGSGQPDLRLTGSKPVFWGGRRR